MSVKKKIINKTLGLEADLYKQLRAAADANNRDLSKHMRHVLKESVGGTNHKAELRKIIMDCLHEFFGGSPRTGK